MEENGQKTGHFDPKVEGNTPNMGLFTAKEEILPNYAMIGEDNAQGDIQWCIVDWDYAQSLYVQGVLEDRGSKVVNGIVYKLYYLPPPPHSYSVGP